MKKPKLKIGKRFIGENYKPVIIAELGINHNGSLERAFNIVKSAIKSGAEIIKHQTHVLEDEMSSEAKFIKPGNSNENIFDIIKKYSLNIEEEFKLMNYVKNNKKIFISTPFSRKAVDRLVKFKVPAFKIGSGECNNYLLVDYIAKQKKPIILSTGMNSISSIKPNIKIFNKYKINYALLHCTNIYPTPEKLVRLNALEVLKKKFPQAVIGLSDHTSSIYTSLGAIALGASIIEKHFTDHKKRKGPDISSSMDKNELVELKKGSEIIFLAKGNNKKALKEEKKTINFAFASAASTRNIKKGEKLNLKNFFLMRPSGGDYNIKNYKYLLNKRAKKNIPALKQIKKSWVI